MKMTSFTTHGLYLRPAASRGVMRAAGVLMLALAGLWPGQLRAQDMLTTSGSWNVPANWSSGVPTGSVNPTIDNNLTAILPAGVSGTGWCVMVGSSGTGTLNITGGSLSLGLASFLGYQPTGYGVATISSGTWATLNSSLNIGEEGTGILNINGGLVTDYWGVIGDREGSNGTVVMTGGTWNSNSGVYVGEGGTGTLNQSGGTISALYGYIGVSASSSGVATVTGGTWINTYQLYVGYSGTGTLAIGGGLVSADSGFIGCYEGSTGSVTVTGGTLAIASTLYVGYWTSGTLTLSGGEISIGAGTGTLVLASATDSVGTLDIEGNGLLNAAEVYGGSGTATVNFNQAGAYTFAPRLTGALTVNQNGAGETILTGSNTYSGGTVLNTGTLGIGNASALGTGTLTINGGALANTSGSAITLTTNNAQQWNSGFTFIGLDSLNLGTGAVTLGTTCTVTIQTDTLTVGGSIGDGGNGYGLVKAGYGTLILTGSNTYTGLTQVNQGTLQIGDGSTAGASLASSSGIVVGPSGQLIVNLPSSNPLALSGTLINNGYLLFSGESSAGNVSIQTNNEMLFANNSSAGNAQIHQADNGILIFENTASAGNAQIQLTGSNSYILFQGTATAGNAQITIQGASGTSIWPSGIYFAETASGGNASVNLATAASVMDLSNLTSGSTTIGSLAGSGTVRLGGKMLTVGGNDASTEFSGVIADGGISVYTGTAITTTGGSIVKTGAGTWLLSGANTYSGSTTVESGTLILNGSVAGSVAVNGGVLGGSGTVGGSLFNASLVSPGNSPGTLTVAGDYEQTAAGTLLIQIASATDYDKLIVGGHATLSGTLSVSLLGGYTLTAGDRFAFITAAGGVSGTFSTVAVDSVVTLQVTYDPLDVSLAPELVAVQGAFADVAGLTPNERAVAKGLDKVVNNSRVTKLVSYLDSLSLREVPGKLEAIVPTDLIPMFDAVIASNNVQATNLERRMNELQNGATGFSSAGLSLSDPRSTRSYDGKSNSASPLGKDGKELGSAPLGDRWGCFINGSGEFVDEESTSIARGAEFATGGMTSGADYRLGDHAAAGLTAGYANTSSSGLRNNVVNLNSGKLGAYATAFGSNVFVNTAVGCGINSYDTKRATLGGNASGDTDGNDFSALLGTGYTYRNQGFSAGPIASARYSWVGIDGFTEHGSLAPLRIGTQSEDSLQSTAGVQTSYTFRFCDIGITPQVRAQWQHEYLNTTRGVGASFLPGGAFTVNGPDIGRDSLLVDAGVTFQISPALGLYAYYTGDIGRANYSSNSVFGGVQVNF